MRHDLLARVLPAAAIDETVTGLTGSGFERRYGLRYDQPLIRFRLLDPALPLEARPERLSLEHLHDQVARARFEDAEVADSDDVGMIEATGGDRLPLEPLRGLAVTVEVGVEHLDRHRATDAGVLATIDAPHPAGAEHRIDAVAPVQHGAELDIVRVGRWRCRRHQPASRLPRGEFPTKAPGVCG